MLSEIKPSGELAGKTESPRPLDQLNIVQLIYKSKDQDLSDSEIQRVDTALGRALRAEAMEVHTEMSYPKGPMSARDCGRVVLWKYRQAFIDADDHGEGLDDVFYLLADLDDPARSWAGPWTPSAQ